MHSDRFDVVIGLVSPDFLENQGGSDGLTMTLQQAVQQFEFEVRQAYRSIKPDRFKSFRHQGQWTVTEDFVMVAACSNRCSIAAA